MGSKNVQEIRFTKYIDKCRIDYISWKEHVAGRFEISIKF